MSQLARIGVLLCAALVTSPAVSQSAAPLAPSLAPVVEPQGKQVEQRTMPRRHGIRLLSTLFRPEISRRRMVRARKRALAAIRKLERDLETFRSLPPPGLSTNRRETGCAQAEQTVEATGHKETETGPG